MVCKVRGLCVGPHSQHMDHLGPLCALLEIPLIVTDPEVFIAAQSKGITPELDLNLSSKSLQQAEAFFYVEPAKTHASLFQWGSKIFKKRALSFWGWHGNSNKYRDEFWAERGAHEDALLYYGPFMQDFLNEKGVWDRIPYKIHVGHYRRLFSQINVSLPSNKRKILYAPTWNFPGKQEGSPFFEIVESVLEAVPDDVLFIVKPHPYTFALYSKELSELRERYQDQESIFFLEKDASLMHYFPHVEAFVGDYSSVGYDFLFEGKPLYFLAGQKRDPYLFSCGKEVSPGTLFKELDRPFPKEYLERGKELYTYCFGERQPTIDEIRYQVSTILSCAL
jgi:hypothetical protein